MIKFKTILFELFLCGQLWTVVILLGFSESTDFRFYNEQRNLSFTKCFETSINKTIAVSINNIPYFSPTFHYRPSCRRAALMERTDTSIQTPFES